MKRLLCVIPILVLNLSLLARNYFSDPQQGALSDFLQSPVYLDNTIMPYTITSPGHYVLIENISYNASSSTPAITINSDNVWLDLVNYSITQAGTYPGVSALSISNNTNITIRSGTIKDFTQSGISVSSGASKISLTNIHILGAGNRAIEVIGSPSSPVEKITIDSCVLLSSCTTSDSDNVLTLSHVNDADIIKCTLIDNGSTAASGALTMVKATHCLRSLFSDIETRRNQGASDIRGFSLNSSSECTFENCTVHFQAASSSPSVCTGFQLESSTSSTGNFFKNCIARSLLAATTVNGFFIGSGCDENQFLDCTATYNQATDVDSVAHGIRSENNIRCSFYNCLTCNNSAVSSTISPYGAYGFKFDTVTAHEVSECLARDQAASNSSVGFYLENSADCVFTKNKSHRNDIGFDNQGTFNNNTWVENLGTKNASSQYNGFSATAITTGIAPGSINLITAPKTNIGIV